MVPRARRGGAGGARARSPVVIVTGVFDHVTIRASDREASERFYTPCSPHSGSRRPTPARSSSSGTTSRSRRWRPASRSRGGCTSVSWRRPRARRCLPPRGRRGRLPRRRRARPAAAVPRRLLRRVPARPGRQQRRGRLPRRPAPRRHDRPPVGAGRRRRRVAALLRDDRAGRSASRPGATRRARAGRRPDRVVLARRRPADRGRAHRLPGRDDDATVAAFQPCGDRGRATATTAARASGPSTTRATTARSCSTPTATTSRLVNHNR